MAIIVQGKNNNGLESKINYYCSSNIISKVYNNRPNLGTCWPYLDILLHYYTITLYLYILFLLVIHSNNSLYIYFKKRLDK